MEQPSQHYHLENPTNEIDIDRYASLIDLLDEACVRHRQRRAATLMGRDLSYEELSRAANAIAGWLQQQGLQAGDRVALMMPNILPYLATLVGVLRAGMTVVNINPLYSTRELEHTLRDASPKAIFVLSASASMLVQMPSSLRPAHVVSAELHDMVSSPSGSAPVLDAVKDAQDFATVLRLGAAAGFTKPRVSMSDIAVLQYTGGTTGIPKGAMLTHRNLVANVLQVHAALLPTVADVDGQALNILAALPLYHIFALNVCALYALYSGMCSVLVPSARDLSAVEEAWRRDPIHILPGVNTLFNGLAHRKEFASLDFSRLKLCLGGGAAVQRPVAENWQAITGVPLIEGYGLSETSPVVSVCPTDSSSYSGDVGYPVAMTEIRLLDEAGLAVPVGQRGEVVVRGPQVMKGYWRNPQETEAAFTNSGFFKTGDIGIVNAEGRLELIDRKKDMIIVSGFNVYPNEVEDVASEHPGVLECAAVGVPDDRTGEIVKLYVVREAPTLQEQDLRAWCRERLTGYKRPRLFEFRTELPKSAVGKILRRALRDEVV